MLKVTSVIFWALSLLISFGFGVLQGEDKVASEKAAGVRNFIESYVKHDSALKGGFFIYDEEADKVLNLKYDYVHKGVDKTEGGEYFACVDFMDNNKNTYDIDFYLDQKGEIWEVSDLVIHKVNGKQRLKQR